MKNELPVPDAVKADETARELLRVWAGGGQEHVTLATGLWRDPGAWGILFVDLARHVARAYQQTEGIPELDVLKRIRETFDVEWRQPTDKPTGNVS
jgi:Domain of unknown function (DUF5076)